MKFVILPLTAIGLLTAAQAGAESIPVQADAPQMSDAPRTKRERKLGLEGKPRGQQEQPAPDDDGHSTEEPDDDEDDDLGEALREVQPSKPQAR